MNRKTYLRKLKYYALSLLCAVPPMVIIGIITFGKIKEGVLWVVTIVFCLLTLFIALLLEPKFEARRLRKIEEQKAKNKDNNFDPYSD